MIIFGDKQVLLQSTTIEGCPCPHCGHEIQRVLVYRSFFELFFLPFIPLRKYAIISCPYCGYEAKKRKFLRDVLKSGKNTESLDSILTQLISESILPTRTKILSALSMLLYAGLTIATINGFKEADQKKRSLISSYIKNPVDKTLIVIHEKDSAYPYSIAYVAKVDADKLVVFQWNYSYDSASGIDEVIKKVRETIKKGHFGTNFHSPVLIPKTTLQEMNIIRVDQIDIPVDWERYLPKEEAPKPQSHPFLKK